MKLIKIKLINFKYINLIIYLTNYFIKPLNKTKF